MSCPRLDHRCHRLKDRAIAHPLIYGHPLLKMRRQMSRSFVPTVKGLPAEATVAPDPILALLEQIQVRVPARPFPTAMELVQVLPQVILAREGSFL